MSLYFAERVMPRLLSAALGGVMRAPFLRWAGRTTLDVLRGPTSNDELIAVLTGQWGDYALPPKQSSFAAHAAIAGHYFEGAEIATNIDSVALAYYGKETNGH